MMTLQRLQASLLVPSFSCSSSSTWKRTLGDSVSAGQSGYARWYIWDSMSAVGKLAPGGFCTGIEVFWLDMILFDYATAKSSGQLCSVHMNATPRQGELVQVAS